MRYLTFEVINQNLQMSALGISMMLVGLGAQALGQSESAKANNAIRKKLLERSDSLNNVFNRDMNMDYMETPGVKNTMAAYGKQLKEVSKDEEGRATMAGASPEATIAGKQAINENYGEFIRKVASGQDAYRADKERLYSLRRDQMDNDLLDIDRAEASRWDNFASNASKLGVAGISAGAIQDEGGSGVKAGDWLKKLFKGGMKPSAGVQAAYDARF